LLRREVCAQSYHGRNFANHPQPRIRTANSCPRKEWRPRKRRSRNRLPMTTKKDTMPWNSTNRKASHWMDRPRRLHFLAHPAPLPAHPIPIPRHSLETEQVLLGTTRQTLSVRTQSTSARVRHGAPNTCSPIEPAEIRKPRKASALQDSRYEQAACQYVTTVHTARSCTLATNLQIALQSHPSHRIYRFPNVIQYQCAED
jgi:hypothetical protein